MTIVATMKGYMNQCICNFSSKADDNEMLHNHMCNNHASLEIPYHTILRMKEQELSFHNDEFYL